jgi:hydrogenase maturation protease
MNIVILGLGNPILTDDAVGLRVVEKLRVLLAENPVDGIEVLVSTRAGFELIDLLQGFKHAIIVDAVQVEDPQPGKIRKLGLEHVRGNTRLNSIHEISLVTAFDLAKKLGIPMPESVQIYAIEGKDLFTLSEEMNPEVAEVVEPLAGEIYEVAKELAMGLNCEDEEGEGEVKRKYNRAFYTTDDK